MASAHGACNWRAVRAVQHQAPVAKLVAEPLEHQRAVVGQIAGRLPLLGQVPDEVGRRQVVQSFRPEPGRGLGRGDGPELAAEGADRRAELGWPARRVALPERQPARLPGCG